MIASIDMFTTGAWNLDRHPPFLVKFGKAMANYGIWSNSSIAGVAKLLETSIGFATIP